MKEEVIRLSGLINDSIVDGPGIRFVVFTQGCPHHCPGCHNEHTWDFSGGQDYKISEVIRQIEANPILKGVTFSGGEPFMQSDKCVLIAEHVRQRGLDVVAYTGFTLEELMKLAEKDKNIMDFLLLIDILIDGRFDISKRDLTLKYVGSSNQRVIDLKKTLLGEAIVLIS